jgi:hypothetical protein
VEEENERLVVDWSPLDRSKLEATARRGVVPIRLDGCRARIVDSCILHRSYSFAATSRQREVMVLRDRDELGARLPVLATRLGAEFSRMSALDVTMTVVGRYELGAAPLPPRRAELEGDCTGVTHVVASISVGDFAISTRATTSAEVSADIAHGLHAHERSRLDAAGVEDECARVRRSDPAPPDDCGIPLRVELRALSSAPAPPPAPPPQSPPSIPEADDMKRAMTAAKKQLVPCHRAARATSPNLSGLLTLAIKLGRTGNVRSVSAKHEGNLDDELAECAAERVAMVSFPPADDDRPRSLVIPVLFAPLAK